MLATSLTVLAVGSPVLTPTCVRQPNGLEVVLEKFAGLTTAEGRLPQGVRRVPLAQPVLHRRHAHLRAPTAALTS